MTTATRAKANAYERVTERMLALLEAGTVPWHQPWTASTGPRSLSTGRVYHGINALLLACAGYDSPWWGTYKAWAEHGRHVARGEHGWPIVLWKFIDVRDEDDPERTRRVGFLRHFVVFNLAQTEGDWEPPALEQREHEPLETAEALVAGYLANGGPHLQHNGPAAWYQPGTDTVVVPDAGAFEAGEAYYATLFHELTHSTGHKDRLDRLEKGGFGSGPYAREELVAELGAAFLCADVDIARQVEQQSAAYLENWAQVLRGDARLIVQAASAATKAARWIHGETKEEA